jgi:hypothetical protein
MKPKPSVSAVQTDLSQTELKSIINLHHPLVKLAGEFDWDAFKRQQNPTYAPVMGAPGINTTSVTRNSSQSGWKILIGSFLAACSFSPTKPPSILRA